MARTIFSAVGLCQAGKRRESSGGCVPLGNASYLVLHATAEHALQHLRHCIHPRRPLSFRATHLLGQVETRNDHACVAPALLPVLAPSRRTLSHRQECLCHTIPGADEAFVIGSGARNLLFLGPDRKQDSSRQKRARNDKWDDGLNNQQASWATIPFPFVFLRVLCG